MQPFSVKANDLDIHGLKFGDHLSQDCVAMLHKAGSLVEANVAEDPIYKVLSKEKRPIFFLLKTKCHVVADDIGVNNGDIVLKGIENYIPNLK